VNITLPSPSAVELGPVEEPSEGSVGGFPVAGSIESKSNGERTSHHLSRDVDKRPLPSGSPDHAGLKKLVRPTGISIFVSPKRMPAYQYREGFQRGIERSVIRNSRQQERVAVRQVSKRIVIVNISAQVVAGRFIR